MLSDIVNFRLFTPLCFIHNIEDFFVICFFLSTEAFEISIVCQ